MSIMETGFVSKEQEDYLRMHEPSLYKAVLKKHGSFIQAKKRKSPVVQEPVIPEVMLKRRTFD